MDIATLSLNRLAHETVSASEAGVGTVNQAPIPFEFSGTAAEYFRIWVVNVALSILTLGIYSAWAKVRRMRYFYGSTSVAGSSFGYHASPLAILRGRVITYGMLLTLATLRYFWPVARQLLYLALGLSFPWIIVRAIAFRNANSSYRGIRFGFTATAADAWRALVLTQLLALCTLFVMLPSALFRQREFPIQYSTYGSHVFRVAGDASTFYSLFWRAVGLFVASLAVAFALLAGTIMAAVAVGVRVSPDDPSGGPGGLLALEFIVLMAMGAGVAYTYFRTASHNAIWNTVWLGDHRFASSARTRDMLRLYATSLPAIIATAGLAIPWVQIRLARYHAATLQLLPGGSLDSFVPGESNQTGAGSMEVADALGFDIGI